MRCSVSPRYILDGGVHTKLANLWPEIHPYPSSHKPLLSLAEPSQLKTLIMMAYNKETVKKAL